MSTIASNLNRLQKAKSDLKAALEAKGVNVGDLSIGEYASLVEDLPTGAKSHTGHVDVEGLKGLGWTDDDIAFLKEHVWWDREDDDAWKVANGNSGTFVKATATTLTTAQKKALAISMRGVDMSKVKTIDTFKSCTNLFCADLSGFNTSSATSMRQMFNSCAVLKSVDLSSCDTSKVTTFDLMFSGCYSLKNINLSSFRTPSLTIMSNTFANCYSLQRLDLSAFDMSNVTNISSTFNNCRSLTYLKIKGVKVSFNVSYSPLCRDSILYIINNLEEVSEQTLTLGADNLAKITDAEKSVATNKGWTLA